MSERDPIATLRLHPLSWLFVLASSIGAFIVPFLVLLFVGLREDDPGRVQLMVAPVIILALLARAIWLQRTYRYGFGPQGLVIREGLLFSNVRLIEYARIENIDVERTLLHRLFGVAQARVQTSTGGKPEALINVLGEEAVQEMRDHIFSSRPATEDAAATGTEELLLHLPPVELVRFGLASKRGFIVVAAGIGLLQQVGFLERLRAAGRIWESGPLEQVAALGPLVQLGIATATVLFVFIALLVLSVAVALVTMHDFRLTLHEGDLRIRHGLLTQTALTLRTRRIQAVHQTETLVHRLLGRVSLDVDLAGDSGGDDQQSQARRTRWLAPVCSPSRAPHLIAMALPEVDHQAPPEWQPLAAGARRRIFRRVAATWIIVLAAPAIWYLREAAVIVLAVIPLAWLHAHLYVKHTRWALTPDTLLFRSGWLSRRLSVVPRDRIQSVRLGTSPFDRRSDMASVLVDTAGASAMRGTASIRYLPAGTAASLAASLFRTAGSTNRVLRADSGDQIAVDSLRQSPA